MMKRMCDIKVCLMIAALLAAGCATSPTTTGDLMLAKGANTRELGKKWNSGHRMQVKGQEMQEEGKEMILDGEDMVKKGKRLMEKGEEKKKDGEKMINEGKEMATKGKGIMDESEKEFSAIAPSKSP